VMQLAGPGRRKDFAGQAEHSPVLPPGVTLVPIPKPHVPKVYYGPIETVKQAALVAKQLRIALGFTTPLSRCVALSSLPGNCNVWKQC